MRIPVFRALNTDLASSIADDLRQHGLVVIDMSRTGAIELAARLAEELDVDEEDDSEDAAFLLQLSCEVEPVMEYGWSTSFIAGRSRQIPWKRRRWWVPRFASGARLVSRITSLPS